MAITPLEPPYRIKLDQSSNLYRSIIFSANTCIKIDNNVDNDTGDTNISPPRLDHKITRLGPEEDFSIVHNDASRSNDVKDRIDYAMNLSKKWKKQDVDVDGDDVGPMNMKHMNMNMNMNMNMDVNGNKNANKNANKNDIGGNSSSGSETGYTSSSSSSSTNSNSHSKSNSNRSETEDDSLSFSEHTHTHESFFDDIGLDNEDEYDQDEYDEDEDDDYSFDTDANVNAPTTSTSTSTTFGFAGLADLGILPSEIELIQAIILAEKASQSGQADFKTTDQSKSALNEVKLTEIAARVVEATVAHRDRVSGGGGVGGVNGGKKGTMARRRNGKFERQLERRARVLYVGTMKQAKLAQDYLVL